MGGLGIVIYPLYRLHDCNLCGCKLKRSRSPAGDCRGTQAAPQKGAQAAQVKGGTWRCEPAGSVVFRC